MSKNINHIFLKYKEKEEKIIFPKNYEELKTSFSEKFIKESSKNFEFKYLKSQNLYIIKEHNFSEAIETIKKNKDSIIYIEDITTNQNQIDMNGLFPSNESRYDYSGNQANGSEIIIEQNKILINNDIHKSHNENNQSITEKFNIQNKTKESQINNTNEKRSIKNHINDMINKIKQENINLKQEIEKTQNNVENNENKKNKTMLLDLNLNIDKRDTITFVKLKRQTSETKKQKKLNFINNQYQKEKNVLIKNNIEMKIKEEQKAKEKKLKKTQLKIQSIKQNQKNNEFEEYKIKTETQLISLRSQIKEKDICINKKNEEINNLYKQLNELKELIKEKNKNELLLKEYKNKIEFLESKEKEHKEKYEQMKKEYCDDLNKKFELFLIQKNQEIFECKNSIEKNEKFMETQFKKYEKSLNNFNNNIIINKNEAIHEGIKCNNCLKKPIIGNRYKCNTCNNYNLCEDCQNRNINDEIHSHPFSKIKNSELNKNKRIEKNEIINNNNIINNYINQENNKIHNIKNPKKDLYSFKCINNEELLEIIVLEKSQKLNMEILIENTGKNTWPLNRAKLVFNENFHLIGKDIILEPQKLGEFKNYEINISDLHMYPYGKYTAELIFKVDEEQCGDKIRLNIEIINEEEKIKEFRIEYDLSIEYYPHNDILNALKVNKYNYEKAFHFLFSDV